MRGPGSGKQEQPARYIIETLKATRVPRLRPTRGLFAAQSVGVPNLTLS